MKYLKCPKTLSGKHLFSSEFISDDGIYWYRPMYPKCALCGVYDDSKPRDKKDRKKK